MCFGYYNPKLNRLFRYRAEYFSNAELKTNAVVGEVKPDTVEEYIVCWECQVPFVKFWSDVANVTELEEIK